MAAKTISVTIKLIPSFTQEQIQMMAEQVVHSEIRRRGIRVTEYDTIEEALCHRGAPPKFCVTCDEPAIYGCPCGDNWCGEHKCPQGPGARGVGGVIPAANDPARPDSIPAEDSLPRAADPRGGEDDDGDSDQ